METEDIARKIWSGWMSFIRKFVFGVLRVGVIPSHIAVIMDGNRRYAKKKKLDAGAGHDAGALALLYLFVYCYELGVKYLSAYAFSIDNFRRKPHEVQKIMDLLRESITLLTRIAKHRPVRVHFAGNLQLLTADLRDAALRLMEATAHHSEFVFTICVCYTCSDEIIHAVQESCQEKCDHGELEIINGASSCLQDGDGHVEGEKIIKLGDIEKHMYMAIAPDPEILIRSGNEHRLSNFLSWQTCCSELSFSVTVWPEFGIWHLVWVILKFQRNHLYFKKMKI